MTQIKYNPVLILYIARNAAQNDPFPEMAFEADEYIIDRYFKNELIGLPVDQRFNTIDTKVIKRNHNGRQT